MPTKIRLTATERDAILDAREEERAETAYERATARAEKKKADLAEKILKLIGPLSVQEAEALFLAVKEKMPGWYALKRERDDADERAERERRHQVNRQLYGDNYDDPTR